MPGKTRIEWATDTWNPITGCSKVSPGCAHCYAETLALTRLTGRPGYPGLPWTPENAAANVRLRPERLDVPLRWTRPRRIFVNSMSDLFHDLVPDDFILRVFDVMRQATYNGGAGYGRIRSTEREGHVFQVLTKRPERMASFVGRLRFDPVAGLSLDGPGVQFTDRDIWLGTSIENNRFVGRADALRATPARVRFISAEPLLGPLPGLDLTGIDWLIVGGESGPDARPMHSDWARDLRDRAHAAGVAFLFKQWGAWARGSNFARLGSEHVIARDGRHFPWSEASERFPGGQSPQLHLEVIRPTSKHLAGRELDGRTWDEYPA